MAENKVRFGLKNVYYSLITYVTNNAPTYATPVAIPGAVNLSLAAQGDPVEFYADNMLFYTAAQNNGYQGDLEIARIPDSFRTAILGETLDSTSKILFENANTEPAHFALLFEFSGDQKATRHVMYDCTVTRPTVASQTTTNTREPSTETMTITAIPRADGVVKASSTDETPTATYNGWFSAVVTPPAASAPASEE